MSSGYLYWPNPYLNDPPYLDGHTFEALDWPGSISWTTTPGILVIPTLAQTHVLQRPWTGRGAPVARQAFTFGIEFLAADRPGFVAVERAATRGGVAFYPGLYATEMFNVTTGGEYRLSRTVAWDEIAGVSAATHPLELRLDGAVAPSAATVNGRTVTASDDGLLEVGYPALFRVVVTDYRASATAPNRLDITCTLEEVLTP